MNSLCYGCMECLYGKPRCTSIICSAPRGILINCNNDGAIIIQIHALVKPYHNMNDVRNEYKVI